MSEIEKNLYKLPFWTVLTGVPPQAGFCHGFASKEEADRDAAARNERAIKLDIAARYTMVHRPDFVFYA